MADFKLKPNQAALILEASDDGEINVDIAIPGIDENQSVIATVLCKAIAKKLVSDEQFQAEMMLGLEGEV